MALGIVKYTDTPNSHSPLTKGEKKLAGLFGEAVNSNIVQKNLSLETHGNAAAEVSDERNITFLGQKHHEYDYSKAKSGFNFVIYVHEMVHIWQNQTYRRHTNGTCYKDYTHTISPHDEFEEYCNEQQAAIIENYARRFLVYPHLPSRFYERKEGSDTQNTDRALQKLVENYFPQASSLRKSLKEKHLSKKLLAL